MKRGITIIALVIFLLPVFAQNGEQGADQFYEQTLVKQRRPLPFPFLRETDIVWSTEIWKTIDLNEKFNQFFYFPIDNDGKDGRKSLAYILWDAMAAGEIRGRCVEDTDGQRTLRKAIHQGRHHTA